MTTKTIDHQELICFELLGRLERRGKELASDDPQVTHDYGDLEHVGVPWKPAMWIGRRLARTERRAFCLTVRKMESAGLVERVAAGYSNRTTHLRPGVVMLEQADELTGGGPDLDAIARGLESTNWGKRLADVARKVGGNDE